MLGKVEDFSTPRVILRNNFTLEVFLDEESRNQLLHEEYILADFMKDSHELVPIELRLDKLSRYVSVGNTYELYLTKEQLVSKNRSYFSVNSPFEDKKPNHGNPLEIHILSNK